MVKGEPLGLRGLARLGMGVDRYAAEVAAGKLIVSDDVRVLCENHQKVRDSVGRRVRWLWRPDLAGHAIYWIARHCRTVAGDGSGEYYRLIPWQKFVIGMRMGWVAKSDPREKRFTASYIETAKGSSKSVIEMAMLFYAAHHLWPKNSMSRVMARNLEQASRVCIRYAESMVQADPFLRQHWHARREGSMRFTTSLVNEKSKMDIGAVPDAHRGKGLSGDFLQAMVMDEYHEVDDPSLFNNVVLGLKGERNTMAAVITNAGLIGSPCWDLRGRFQDAIRRHGRSTSMEEERMFGFICYNKEEDEPWLLKNHRQWQKSNPGLLNGVPSKNYIRRSLKALESDPEDASRKLFSIWRTSDTPLLRQSEWEEILRPECPFTREQLDEGRLLIAVDRGTNSNYTAIARFYDLGEEGWVEFSLALPAKTVERESQNDRENYWEWERQGWLTIEPNVQHITPGLIAGLIADSMESGDTRGVCYDPWNMSETIELLSSDGRWDFEFQDDLRHVDRLPVLFEHAQGLKIGPAIKDTATNKRGLRLTMMDSLQEFLSMVRSSPYKLHVQESPPVHQCISNARAQHEPDGRTTLGKLYPRAKNDAISVLLMAIGLRRLLYGASSVNLIQRIGNVFAPSRFGGGNWQGRGISYEDLYHKDGTPRTWGFHNIGLGQLARMADANPTIRKARRVLTTGVSDAIVDHLEVLTTEGAASKSARARKAKQLLCRKPRSDAWISSRDWLRELVSDMMYVGYAFVRPVYGSTGLLAFERLTLTEGWIRDYAGAAGGFGREILREDSELSFRNQNGDIVDLKFGEVIYIPLEPSSSPWGFELPSSPLAALAGAMALTVSGTRTHVLSLDSNNNIWNSHVISGGAEPRGTGRAGKARTEQLAGAESGAAKDRKAGTPYRLPGDAKLEKTLVTPQESEVKEARNYVIQAVSDVYGMPAVILGGSIDSRVASGYVEARRSLYAQTISPLVGTMLDAFAPRLLSSGERFFVSGVGSGRFEFGVDSVMKALGTQQSPAIMTRRTAAAALGLPVDQLDEARREHEAFLDRVKSPGGTDDQGQDRASG